VQCKHCNDHLSGNLWRYRLFLVDKYGRATTERLERLKHETRQFTKEELVELRMMFMAREKELKEELEGRADGPQNTDTGSDSNNTYHPDDFSTDADQATDAQPGADKLEILAERQARGEPLWNVGDKTVFREGMELIGNRCDEHLPRRAAAGKIVGPGLHMKKKRRKK
jgi:hypothetical protein